MNKKIFFTVGPSQLHKSYVELYKQAIDDGIGNLNHRSKEFQNIYKHADEQLRELLGLTNKHCIFFASSASELWERIILNLVHTQSTHLITGDFSKKFSDYAVALQKKVVNITSARGELTLLPASAMETELMCLAQNDTSTGVFINNAEIEKLKTANNLLCADITSIAPLGNINYQKIDCSFFSVQKCFGMPPGLGVLVANTACIDKSNKLIEQGVCVGAHNTFKNYYSNYKNWETPTTPNVIAIYILGKIAQTYNARGISNINNEINFKASMLYSYANNSNILQPLVKTKSLQSPTTIVLQCKHNVTEFIAKLSTKGFEISTGYGAFKNAEVRIANFPTTTSEQMQSLITALQNVENSL